MRGNSINFLELGITSGFGYYLRSCGYWLILDKPRRETQLSSHIKMTSVIFSCNMLLEIFNFPLSRIRSIAYTNLSRENKLWKSLSWLVRDEGFSKLYKGFGIWSLGLTLQMTSISSLMYFSNNVLGVNQNYSTLLAVMLTSPLFYPFETIVRRLQVDGVHHPSLWNSSAKRLIRFYWEKEGIKGFYSGFPIYLLINFLSTAGVIWTFKTMSNSYRVF
jgi:hypothetical protein